MIQVQGEKDGVMAATLYKSRKAALKFAAKLANSEVYDLLRKEYIGGTSKWARLMLAQVKEMEEISKKRQQKRIERAKEPFESL